MLLLLLPLLGCPIEKGAAADSPGDTAASLVDTADTAADTASDCPPLAAMLLDLGETLVLEQESGLFDPAPGAPELLAALTARGVPLGVVASVPRRWTRADVDALLSDPSILDPFEVVLLSSEAEADDKPDPAIYLEALGLFASAPLPAHSAFVSEELSDIADAEPPTEGARAAGLIGVHLSDAAPDPLATYTFAPSALASIADAPWVECVAPE